MCKASKGSKRAPLSQAKTQIFPGGCVKFLYCEYSLLALSSEIACAAYWTGYGSPGRTIRMKWSVKLACISGT